MSEELNMIVAGLTGQGTVLMNRILATALLAEGKRVLMTDVPAPTHRFSGTFSHIRWGEKIHSEVVPDGEADLVVGLEPVETLRIGLRLASENGLVIMNERLISRMIVSIEFQKFYNWRPPNTEKILEYFKRVGVNNVKYFNASDVAVKETGSVLSMNMVMLGAAYGTDMIPVKPEAIEKYIATFAPKRTIDANLKAFRAGIQKFKELA